MDGLLAGGAVKMRSKPWTKEGDQNRDFTYNYYTLRRVRYPNDGNHTWRDNARPISDIVNARADKARWNVYVAKENYHGSIGDDDNRKDAKLELEADGEFVQYQRYPKFREWSN